MLKALVRKSVSYSKYPDDLVIKGSFFKFRKMYSQACKKKKRAFKMNILEKMDNPSKNDPSEYWKLVKELKDEDNNEDPSNKISPDVWISHVSNLVSVKNKFHKLEKRF